MRFGSSTIVVSIEAIRRADGRYEAYTDNGREKTAVDAVEWAAQAAALGAGELVITSIDREGTGEGFDLALTRDVAAAVDIPVIASGGAGRPQHAADALAAGAAAVALASVLHYDLLSRHAVTDAEFAPEINLAHLQTPGFGRIQAASLLEVKATIADRGFASRPHALLV